MLRSLKKALALSVVIAMMLSTVVAFAAVPADVKGTKYEDAARSLGILKIMVGDDKGNFNAEADVTRAEIAKVIVAATGITNVVAGNTKFSDVTSSHWASGYVNFASGQGIVKGTSDTTFDPEGKVTYEQAVTMIMRALGYEPAATQKGGYPYGYLTLATQYEVTDGVQGAVGQPAKRGAIAQLIYNALDVPMMIQTGYGSDVKYVESGTDGTDEETLLSKKLKVEAYEDVTIKEIDDVEKSIELETNPYDDGTRKADTWDDEHEDMLYNYDVVGDIVLAAYDNATVTIWVNEDDEVVNIINDDNSEVVYDYIDKINGKDSDKLDSDDFDDDFDSVSFKNVKKSFNIDTDLMKFKAQDEDDYEDLTDGDEVLLGEIADGDDLPFSYLVKAVIKENKVTSIEVIWTSDADAEVMGLIKKADKDVITYYTDDKTEEEEYEDFSGDDVTKLVVVIDGVTSNYSDLKEGMYFAVAAMDDEQEQYIIFASTKTAKGKFTSFNEDDLEIKVDDKYYALADTFLYSEEGTDFEEKDAVDSEELFDDLYDQELNVVLNGAGEVAYVTGKSDLSSFYGLVLENDEDDEIKVGFIKEGKYTEKTYSLDSDLKIGTIVGEEVTYADDQTSDDFNVYNKDDEGVYKFELNSDGKIEKATALLDAAYIVSDFNDDEIKTTTGTVDVDKADFYDVKDLDENDVADDSDDIDALDWKIIKDSDEDRVKGLVGFTAYADENGDVRLVAFDANSDKLGALPVLGYVTETPQNTSDDRITSINDGTSVKTYKLDKDDYADVKKEGLVLLQKTGNDTAELAEVSDKYYINYKKLMEIASGTVTNKTYSADEYNYTIGMLDELYPEHDYDTADGELTAIGYGYVNEISSSKFDLYDIDDQVRAATSSKSEITAGKFLTGDAEGDMEGVLADDGDSIKLGDNVMVYKLVDNELSKAGVSSIGKGDKVYFVSVEDEVVFVILVDKDDIK